MGIQLRFDLNPANVLDKINLVKYLGKYFFVEAPYIQT